jgi:hypothetical protein
VKVAKQDPTVIFLIADAPRSPSIVMAGSTVICCTVFISADREWNAFGCAGSVRPSSMKRQ